MIQTENQARIDEILDIVAQKAMIDRSRLTLDAKLSDLEISSLDMVDVMFMLEDKFGIELPFNANTNTDDLKTVGDVVALVEKQLTTKGNPAAAGA
jgi:acyl carrier protein